MDIKITLAPEVESVYLINGEFFEGDSFVVQPDSVVYITVLPLDATFAPYTVKLIGTATDSPMALVCRISTNEFAIRLSKRYGFIFLGKSEPTDLCCKFFYFVKGGHFGFASELLGNELKSGLGDAEMAAFLSDFVDVVKVKGSYFAVDKTGVGHRCIFSVKDGKIDNISID